MLSKQGWIRNTTNINNVEGWKRFDGVGIIKGAYFFADNWSVDFGVGLGGWKEQFPAAISIPGLDSSYSRSYITIRPAVRYYNMVSETVGVYGEFQARINLNRNKFEVDGTETSEPKSTDLAFDISPGIIWFPSPKFAFEFQIGVISYIIEDVGGNLSDNSTTTFETSDDPFQFGGRVAFNWYINR